MEVSWIGTLNILKTSLTCYTDLIEHQPWVKKMTLRLMWECLNYICSM